MLNHGFCKIDVLNRCPLWIVEFLQFTFVGYDLRFLIWGKHLVNIEIDLTFMEEVNMYSAKHEFTLS